MVQQDPKRNVPDQPGPEEHPGEDGQWVNADRTRLKPPVPDRADVNTPDPDESHGSGPDQHEQGRHRDPLPAVPGLLRRKPTPDGHIADDSLPAESSEDDVEVPKDNERD